MICCCSMAGTAACKTCPNNYYAEPSYKKIEYNFTYPHEPISNTPQGKRKSLSDLLKEAVPMKAQIFCRNCGAPIMIYHNFCSNCGEKNEQHCVDGGIRD